MTVPILVVLLATQVTDFDRPVGRVPGKYESLVPLGFRRDPERLLREAQRGGGGRETEDAVLSALGWLSRVQNPDGSWDVPDERIRVQITALALLAFLINQFTPCSPSSLQKEYCNRFASIAPDSSGPLRPPKDTSASFHLTVRRGLRWLIRSQDPEGFFGTRGHYGSLSGHCVATTVLLEAYGRTNLLILRDPAERAIAALIAARSLDGKWRGDTPEETWMVNGWVATALWSAVLSNIPFPRSIYEGLRAWRREHANVLDPGVPWPADFYVGWHMGIVGQRGDDTSRLVLTLDQLRTELPCLNAAIPDFDRWYWTTAAVFHYDHSPVGLLWKKWNTPVMKALLGTQDSTPSVQRGSWPPVHPEGTLGGRAHATAMNALSLSVYHTVWNVFGLR